MKGTGLMLVFTGDGKGKTTAALGAALRMISHGKRVGMVQFFKPSSRSAALSSRFKIWGFGGGFTWKMPRAENARMAQKAWKKCCELLKDPRYALLIFDEIHIALKYKFLKIDEVLRALKKRPVRQHVILTGRGASRGLVRVADLVTEMKCVKHPFHKGVSAQPGLDF